MRSIVQHIWCATLHLCPISWRRGQGRRPGPRRVEAGEVVDARVERSHRVIRAAAVAQLAAGLGRVPRSRRWPPGPASPAAPCTATGPTRSPCWSMPSNTTRCSRPRARRPGAIASSSWSATWPRPWPTPSARRSSLPSPRRPSTTPRSGRCPDGSAPPARRPRVRPRRGRGCRCRARLAGAVRRRVLRPFHGRGAARPGTRPRPRDRGSRPALTATSAATAAAWNDGAPLILLDDRSERRGERIAGSGQGCGCSATTSLPRSGSSRGRRAGAAAYFWPASLRFLSCALT